MPTDLDAPTLPTEAEFALDQLAVEDGTLVVSGRWFGVRGMRFVRPTLIVNGRSILATMAHKPWAPDADPWRAEFPWKGKQVDPETVSIAVTPRLTVPLAGGTASDIARRERFAETAERPRPDLPGTAAKAEAPPAPAGPDGALVAARAERDRLLGSADEARRERAAAERERDQALERLAEAERDRDAAVRTRRRWEDSSDEALRDRDDTEKRLEQERESRQATERERARVQSELNRAEREKDTVERAARKLQSQLERSQTQAAEAEAARQEAEQERDRVRMQRDEALLAYNSMQRRERGARRPAAPSADEPEATEPHGAAPDPAAPAIPVQTVRVPDPQDTVAMAAVDLPEPPEEDDDPDTEAPLGVRRMPAARGAAADLLSTPVRSSRDVSGFDVWAMRILGTVAGTCFILLLVMILRLFV